MTIPTIDLAFADFLLACKSIRKPRTVQWYHDHLREFVQQQQGTVLTDVKAFVIRQYLVMLREAVTHRLGASQVEGSLSQETQRGRVRALKRFFNWSWEEYDLPTQTNPMRKIVMPSRPDYAPAAITMEDLKKMIDSCGNDQVGKRDRAILFFLIDTGCRAAGLIGLRDAHLYLKRNRAVVTEKGDRSRIVPFTEYTAEVLQEWLAVRPLDTEAVFCRLGTAKARIGKPLTYWGLREILRRISKRAEAEGHTNLHAFRHGQAVQFLLAGGDLKTLQMKMGHANPNTTMMFYLRFADREMVEQNARFSAVNQLIKERR